LGLPTLQAGRDPHRWLGDRTHRIQDRYLSLHPHHATGDPGVEIIQGHDFIVVYRGLDPQLCRCIIDRFDRDQGKWRGRVGRSGSVSHQEPIKSSWDLEILHEGPWQDVFQSIHPRIQACIDHYVSRSPILRSFPLQATGFKIQMYPQNQGYFRWHADAAGKDSRDRVVAMVLYLNDVERGGETEFFHQRLKISPRAGHLALFPAGWNYMHCGHAPESNDKYVISTFVRIKD
jgi:hypothetical protein